MKACEQAPGLSILQHGEQVAERYADLHAILTSMKAPKLEWHLPYKQRELLVELANQALTPEQAKLYHVMHDCGKPFCLEIGEDGKRRFPNHAEVSAKLFAQAYPAETHAAKLISKDMLCHLAKADDYPTLLSDTDLPTLLLTAWAEVHANAEMFGGFQSDSFKIKSKRLEKLGRCLLREREVI